MDEAPTLEHLNTSELLQLLKEPERGGHRLRRSVPHDRLIHLLHTGEQPTSEELASTTTTRNKLEVWIQERWVNIGSQLPCTGETRGKCTLHPCSDGRHVDCYLAAKGSMI